MNENRNIDPRLAETVKGVWDSLTAEQKEKAKDCKTWDELAAFAGREGIELPDELLDAVAGGFNGWCFWGGSNPLNIGDPYTYNTLAVSMNHDCAVDDVEIEIENGNYEGAKRYFRMYSYAYPSSSFDIVRQYLNRMSIEKGLGPLM